MPVLAALQNRLASGRGVVAAGAALVAKLTNAHNGFARERVEGPIDLLMEDADEDADRVRSAG